MRRFYFDSTTKAGELPLAPLAAYQLNDTVVLPESVTHHWCRVLRAKVGDSAILFDGFGGEYLVELIEVSKKRAAAELIAFDPIERTPNVTTTIGLVMSRGDRMDYAIQKATELGVSAIQLLTSQHGEVNLKPSQIPKKLLHWQQVAIAACEQCGLNRPPIIIAPKPVDEWLTLGIDKTAAQGILIDEVSAMVSPLLTEPFYNQLTSASDLRLVLAVPTNAVQDSHHMSATVSEQIRNAIQTSSKTSQTAYPSSCHIHLLIGPEGGFSISELQLALDARFNAWQIGNRILRTETAPVVALATLHALCS